MLSAIKPVRKSHTKKRTCLTAPWFVLTDVERRQPDGPLNTLSRAIFAFILWFCIRVTLMKKSSVSINWLIHIKTAEKPHAGTTQATSWYRDLSGITPVPLTYSKPHWELFLSLGRVQMRFSLYYVINHTIHFHQCSFDWKSMTTRGTIKPHKKKLMHTHRCFKGQLSLSNTALSVWSTMKGTPAWGAR